MAGFWTEENLEIAKALLAKGYTASAIGAALGVTKNSVIGAMWRRGRNACLLEPRRRLETAAHPEPILPVMTGCRWLEGDPRDFHYCGKSVSGPGGSWCADHRARVYYTPERRKLSPT